MKSGEAERQSAASGPRPAHAGEAPRHDEVISGRETPDEVYYCDLCGNVMLNLHCKLVCEQCGYKRDCSDP